MMLVDVHAHMDFPTFSEDIDAVIKRNQDAGVCAIISNGVDQESNRKVLALSKKYSIIKPALGIYPVHAIQIREEDFQKECEFIQRQKIIAVGEVGLDYLKGDDNPDGDTHKKLMKERFESMIKIAEKKNVPIIIHSRRAEADCIEMLESSRIKKVVMHCFMGRKHLVKKILNNGWNLSIPCIINKLEQLQVNVEMASTSQILTETDSPYLSPNSEIKRNEPYFVKQTISKMAQIKKLDEIEMANILYQNYSRLFL